MTPKLERLAPAVLIALLVLFVILAAPRRWYNDDTFITYRYARNIAEGHGYVWNVVDGERVEGSSSLGWTLLGAAGIRLGIDPLPLGHGLGLVAGLLGLVLVERACRRGLELSPWWSVVAPALLVAHRQWVLWSVSGMEIAAAATIAFFATMRCADEVAVGRAGAVSGLVFFVATVFRPEMPLLHVAAGAGLLLAATDRRRALRTVAGSGAVHALLLALLTAGRLAYFGQALPNSVVAKIGAVQLGSGLRYLAQFAWQTSGWLWLPLLAIGFVLHWRRPPLLLAALLGQWVGWCAWLALEGGDRWELRFFVPLLPGLAVMLVGALARSHAEFTALLPTPASSLVAVVTTFALIASQAVTLFRPFRPTPLLASAEHLKAVAGFQLDVGRRLGELVGPTDRIATGWAGAIPYASRAWHFDTWGLNDREIARRSFDSDGVLFHQRHANWDDIVARRVMFVDIWNRFLFEQPFRPETVRAEPNPWVRAGVPVYCTRIGGDRFPYWIFASPRPRAEIEAWLAARGLGLEYAAEMVVYDPRSAGL